MSAAPFGIGRHELMFSLKAFLAAVLALWIALSLDLSKPYWAMATAYIVMQPLAAAVTAKAVYRVVGTVLGAGAAVVMVPNLVAVPELLCLALAVWVGGCLFTSLLDRTPRSYVAMLAGYSAAIIAFMAVTAPETVFDVALSRTQEIIVGIVCGALVSRVVAPRHLGPLLTARLDGWLADAGRWASDVLAPRPEPQASARDRRRLATDTVEMLALTTHLPYDTSELRHLAGQVRELQQHMTALLPILSGLEDRLSTLRAGSPLDPRLDVLMGDIAEWIASDCAAPLPPADALRARLEVLAEALRAEAAAGAWRELLVATVLDRLRELVEVWANARMLRADLRDGRARAPRFRAVVARYAGDPQLHVDVPLAALAGLAVGISILMCCALWIATGWSEGSGAAQMAAIFFSLFAVMDNPVPVMRLFARYTLLATIAVGLFAFTLLPLADSFTELVLLMAPFLLVFGALMATPRHGPLGFLMCVNMPLVTMLDARLHLDLAALINASTASLVGMVIATLTAAVLTAMGVEQSIARLRRANSRDLAGIAGGQGGRDTAALVRRLVDRFGLMVQRLVALPKGEVPHPEQALVDLRMGLNMADLQRVRGQLPAAPRQQVEALLEALRRHFRQRETARVADPGLAVALDTAIRLLAQGPQASPPAATALRALVGLRQGLLPGLAAPDPQPAPAVTWSLAT